ncbi:MAG: hypothetical protein U5K99_06145 [Anaerolineales bacterium]|nr:hypothetical protein [Anaerolineales bacterium]
MRKDYLMLANRKLKIALPVILVLVLARCGSGGTAEETASGDDAKQPDYSAEQIRAALKLLKQSGGDAGAGDREYSAEEIKAAMREHIAQRTALGTPGVFEITDPQNQPDARAASSRKSMIRCARCPATSTSPAPISACSASRTRPLIWISGCRPTTAS